MVVILFAWWQQIWNKKFTLSVIDESHLVITEIFVKNSSFRLYFKEQKGLYCKINDKTAEPFRLVTHEGNLLY